MITEKITQRNDQLDIFLDICGQMGYTNNNSLEAMKFNWCIEQGGTWWVTKNNMGKILAISGIHPFMDGYRALFRGAQIESRQHKTLNKYKLQDYTFSDHLYEQIQWANSNKIYVTTNVTNDNSGKMNRVHRSAKVLEKQGVFKYMYDKEIFYVNQSIWKVNIDRYKEIRK
jgi:hypothetical protein